MLNALSASAWLGLGGLPLGPLGRADPAVFRIPLAFLGCIAGRPRGHGRAAEHSCRELVVRSRTGVGSEAVTGTATGVLLAGARVGAPAGWKAVTQ